MFCKRDKDQMEYTSNLDWGNDAITQVKESKINYVKNKTLHTKEDANNTFLFSVNIPAPENINLPNIYVLEKWQKPRIWVNGRHSKIEKAEEEAYSNYKKILNANTLFYKKLSVFKN